MEVLSAEDVGKGTTATPFVADIGRAPEDEVTVIQCLIDLLLEVRRDGPEE